MPFQMIDHTAKTPNNIMSVRVNVKVWWVVVK